MYFFFFLNQIFQFFSKKKEPIFRGGIYIYIYIFCGKHVKNQGGILLCVF